CQPSGLNRLQQIVHGVDFECLYRVLIVRRDEDEVGIDPGSQKTTGDFEPRKARHLNVEQHEVGGMFVNCPQRFDTIARLVHDLDTVELTEQETQLPARQLFVVDDNRAERLQLRAHAVILAGTTSSGMTTRAHVPSPGTLSSWSW